MHALERHGTINRPSCVHQKATKPARYRQRCRAAGQEHSQQQEHLQAQHQAQAALLYDFHDQLIPYDQAWSWQRQRVAELVAAADGHDPRDTVFLLQHPPVYTMGAGSSEEHVKFDLQHPPHPLYRTERGGEVTFHGPGQLVLYPILYLARHTQDLHWYLRGLEEVVIRALAATSGLQGERLHGLTGVWVDGHKMAAIGVRARKWVTYHGLALNVSTDLSPFQHITPCGISDRPVGSVKTALGIQQLQQQQAASSSSSSSSAASILPKHLAAVVHDPLIIEYRYALLESLEEVFGLQLQPATQEQLQLLLQQTSSNSSSSSGEQVGASSSRSPEPILQV